MADPKKGNPVPAKPVVEKTDGTVQAFDISTLNGQVHELKAVLNTTRDSYTVSFSDDGFIKPNADEPKASQELFINTVHTEQGKTKDIKIESSNAISINKLGVVLDFADLNKFGSLDLKTTKTVFNSVHAAFEDGKLSEAEGNAIDGLRKALTVGPARSTGHEFSFGAYTNQDVAAINAAAKKVMAAAKPKAAAHHQK